MSSGDAMSAAIKRRIENFDGSATPKATAAVDAKTAERLASEAAQRKAYEARKLAGK